MTGTTFAYPPQHVGRRALDQDSSSARGRESTSQVLTANSAPHKKNCSEAGCEQSCRHKLREGGIVAGQDEPRRACCRRSGGGRRCRRVRRAGLCAWLSRGGGGVFLRRRGGRRAG